LIICIREGGDGFIVGIPTFGTCGGKGDGVDGEGVSSTSLRAE